MIGHVSPLPDRVLAIMAYGRAGSGLWASLFDSHPDVLTFPDCLLMDFFRFWERVGGRTAGHVHDAFVDHYSVAFDARQSNAAHISRFHVGQYLGLNALGDQRDQHLEVDRGLFAAALRARVDFDRQAARRTFFQAVHVAYAEALGRVVRDPIIVFSLHVDLGTDARRLLDDFPATVFMQTLRDPVKGLGSWFRHFALTNALHPRTALDALDMALTHGRPTTVPEQKARWFGVRLEDVHATPRETLERVCEWIGLPWHPTLMRSTVNGLKWWNEKNTQQISGFSTAITAQSFDEYIPVADQRRLAPVFAARRLAWGYDTQGVTRTLGGRLRATLALLAPLRIERLSADTLPSTRPGMAGGVAGGVKRWRRFWPIYLSTRRALLRALWSDADDDLPIVSRADRSIGPEVIPACYLLQVGGVPGESGWNVFHEAVAAGTYALAAGRLDQAIDLLTAAIGVHANVPEPFALRAEAFHRRGMIARANEDGSCAGLYFGQPLLPQDQLLTNIDRLLQEERELNPDSYNRFGSYQAYDRIGLAGQRTSVEQRMREYGLACYGGPGVRVLDIGSNAGFFVTEFALTCAEAHGVEPNPSLNRIGELTADHLGVRDRVRFFDIPFADFSPPVPYDLILSLAAFFTSDGRERTGADGYFDHVDEMLAEFGCLVYESTGFSRESRPEDPTGFGTRAYAACSAATDAIAARFNVTWLEDVPVPGQQGVFRRVVIAFKLPRVAGAARAEPPVTVNS
jgi:hypothetical protein